MAVDSVSLYMKQIDSHNLLTPEEEIRLFKRLENGDFKAGQKIINSNLRLVVSIAMNYKSLQVELMDMIQDGNLGLMQSLKKFDWRRGLKFSTYATWWIRQGITRGLANNSRVIRLPIHVADTLRRLKAEIPRITNLLGHEPTPEDLIEQLQLDISPDRVKEILRSGIYPMSLASPTTFSSDQRDENAACTIGNRIEDISAESIEDQVFDTLMEEDLDKLLNVLTDRARTVIELRFGIGGRPPQTLKQIGEQLGYTLQRIHQIQKESISKLQSSIHAEALKEWV